MPGCQHQGNIFFIIYEIEKNKEMHLGGGQGVACKLPTLDLPNKASQTLTLKTSCSQKKGHPP